MKKDYLFIRTLKKVDFTVFCVDKEQKSYYDKQFGVKLPYSSGQQVKRCVMETILGELGKPYAPTTFNFAVIDGNKLKEKEITQPCNPKFVDQLIGGWMSKASKDNNDENVNDNNHTRRSPLSVGAMVAVHPLLASLVKEENMTYDRTGSNSESIAVRGKDGKIMSDDEIKDFLSTSNSKLTKRKLITGSSRANGFFRSDIVIDFNKLFRIPYAVVDSETSFATNEELMENGWIVVEDNLGKWLELPKELHEYYAEALAWGIINWRITSNQSRTFDIMPTLSIAISNRGNEIAEAIRGDIYDDDGRTKAKLVVDTNCSNTNIYSTNALKGYLINPQTSYTAIDDAVNEIKTKILEFYK